MILRMIIEMQTFLPYPDFHKTFEVLDYRRLGKQRVEAKQILNALERGSGGWYNHPAVKMWKGYETALKLYHDQCIDEWVARGYNNNMPKFGIDEDVVLPPWIGNEKFHSCHRQTLLFKNFEWYSQFGWTEKPTYEYFWPVS